MGNTILIPTPLDAMLETIKGLSVIANLDYASGLKLESLTTLSNRLVKQIEDIHMSMEMDENGVLQPCPTCDECVALDWSEMV